MPSLFDSVYAEFAPEPEEDEDATFERSRDLEVGGGPPAAVHLDAEEQS